MAKYMIHSCLSRLWYVNKYLMPSMLEQGINKSDIILYVDTQEEGCLKATLSAFTDLANREGGTWHLQDDVIICSDFKERTEKITEYEVACGFCSEYDVTTQIGRMNVGLLWYSFPCIYISNELAAEFVKWVRTKAKTRELYRLFIRSGKYDDTLFNEFINCEHKDLIGYNIAPNLVNHVDYLIGGSTVNKQRPEDRIVSLYWKEPELIFELSQKLDVDKH